MPASRRCVENNGLIWSVVRRYYGRGVDPEDLYQLGCLGFLKAVQGFDFAYGTCFSTYAVPKIAGEIRRFLRDDGAVKVGRSHAGAGSNTLHAFGSGCGRSWAGSRPALRAVGGHRPRRRRRSPGRRLPRDDAGVPAAGDWQTASPWRGRWARTPRRSGMVERIALREAIDQSAGEGADDDSAPLLPRD